MMLCRPYVTQSCTQILHHCRPPKHRQEDTTGKVVSPEQWKRNHNGLFSCRPCLRDVCLCVIVLKLRDHNGFFSSSRPFESMSFVCPHSQFHRSVLPHKPHKSNGQTFKNHNFSPSFINMDTSAPALKRQRSAYGETPMEIPSNLIAVKDVSINFLK